MPTVRLSIKKSNVIDRDYTRYAAYVSLNESIESNLNHIMAMYPYYVYENHTGFVPSPITTIVGPESVWLSFLCIVILLNREAHKRTMSASSH